MEVYRITKTKYAQELSGLGARLYGGRWNGKGTPMLYASGSRALAMLEVLVHANRAQLPGDLELITLKIPDRKMVRLDPAQLSKYWKISPTPQALQQWGSTWVQEQGALAVRVPSVVVPEEDNVLINPLHADMNKVKISDSRKVIWDGRFELET